MMASSDVPRRLLVPLFLERSSRDEIYFAAYAVHGLSIVLGLLLYLRRKFNKKIAFSTIDSRLTTRDTRRVKAPRIAAHSKRWLQSTYVK